MIVTIDGPAASGKSSVSRELARRLGWAWVSTGAFYRGLAYVAHAKGTDLANETELESVATGRDWSIQLAEDQTRVFFQGRDVSDEVARESVGILASKISSFPRVRSALLEAQRSCRHGVRGLIAEGRDCGSIVFPNAHAKFFLTADAADRAARRAIDEGRDMQALIAEQSLRDQQDSNRKAAPLQIVPGSILIDSSKLDFQSVLSQIEAEIRSRLGAQAQL